MGHLPLLRSKAGWVALGLFSAAVACSEDGTTPRCPPLPLYDVSDAAAVQDPAVQTALAEAAAAGCITLPGDASAPNDSGATDTGAADTGATDAPLD